MIYGGIRSDEPYYAIVSHGAMVGEGDRDMDGPLL